jgi:hypothetical protein
LYCGKAKGINLYTRAVRISRRRDSFFAILGTHMQMSKRGGAAGKITPARGTLAAFALVFLGGAASPAYAVPFTDDAGNTCDTSQLIDNPNNPDGPSICPLTAAQDKIANQILTKLTTRRAAPPPVYTPSEDFHREDNPFYVGPAPDPFAPPSIFGLGMYVTPDTGSGNGF